MFAGRQSPGGADVIAGVTAALHTAQQHSCRVTSKFLGFVGGTAGFYAKKFVELDEATVYSYKYTGGFELLGRSADKFDKYEEIFRISNELQLDGLILVGGTITATHGAYLAEYLAAQKSPLVISCVPSSMGGSFKNQFLEQPLGFDSTAKATARLVGNTAIDGSSARKYYYFLRSMEDCNGGSHLSLEVYYLDLFVFHLEGTIVFTRKSIERWRWSCSWRTSSLQRLLADTSCRWRRTMLL